MYIVPKGAWDSETTLTFYEGNGGSSSFDHISPSFEKAVHIDVTAVDKVVKEPITYMKMDIEGSELRALHGAQEQISRNYPSLAISVYHKTEDILDIWNYLRDITPDYRFYIRHHSPCWDDTVLYAIKPQ